MAIATFYSAELTDQQHQINLSAAESAHAMKSRRLRQDAPVQIVNGQGLIASGHIAKADRKQVTIEITNSQQLPRPKPITIASALPKGDRQKVMIDMLTQLGVRAIIPLTCDHSATSFKPSMHDKWQRQAIEACKQSQNPWLPEICAPHTVSDCLQYAHKQNTHKQGTQVVYADGRGSSLDKLDLDNKQDLLIMVGPEGGFSTSEFALLQTQQVTAVKLADHILRTELAAISSMANALTIY